MTLDDDDDGVMVTMMMNMGWSSRCPNGTNRALPQSTTVIKAMPPIKHIVVTAVTFECTLNMCCIGLKSQGCTFFIEMCIFKRHQNPNLCWFCNATISFNFFYQYCFLWTAIRGLVFWMWFIWTSWVLSAPPSSHQALDRKTKTTENYNAERGKWKDFHFHKHKFQSLLSSSPLLLPHPRVPPYCS